MRLPPRTDTGYDTTHWFESDDSEHQGVASLSERTGLSLSLSPPLMPVSVFTGKQGYYKYNISYSYFHQMSPKKRARWRWTEKTMCIKGK